MRILPLSTIITIVMVTVCSIVANGKDAKGMTVNQAFQIVTNASSSPDDFITAIESLDSIAGEGPLWLKLAGDEHYHADRRRRFAKHFFQHFVSVGMSLGEAERIMGQDLPWISYDHISKVQREWSMGWIPSALLKGESGFSIPVLSGASGDYHLVLFISFEQDVALGDLVNELTRKADGNAAAKAKIVAFETWDSDDQEKKYPGSKVQPWPWD